MTDEVQTSQGSFLKKKRPFVPYTTAPPLNDSGDEHSVNTTRSSAALSSSSSVRESSISSIGDSRSLFGRRSASLRSPTKPRSTYKDYAQAVQNVLDKRSISASLNRSGQAGIIFTRDICTTISNPIIRNVEGEILHSSLSPPSSWRQSTASLPSTAPTSGAQTGVDGIDRVPNNSQSQGVQGVFQKILNISSKRISTLDYLRRAHEGQTYWLTSLQFQKADLNRLPYFEPRKLGRRATNYLLLGVSLPTILDPNSDTAVEYLKTFNALLTEFESYQTIHSPDGQSTGSLGRARIPQMFKRAAQGSVPKSRRTSNSLDATSPTNGHGHYDTKYNSGSYPATSSSPYSSFPASEQELLPGEEYSFLLTPFLPFEPDYYETFATLCDVLIDCYTKVIGLINSPDACGPGTWDLFSKSDAKVRKIIMAGMVQDFEEATKQGIRSELAGVGKVILGGLL